MSWSAPCSWSGKRGGGMPQSGGYAGQNGSLCRHCAVAGRVRQGGQGALDAPHSKDYRGVQEHSLGHRQSACLSFGLGPERCDAAGVRDPRFWQLSRTEQEELAGTSWDVLSRVYDGLTDEDLREAVRRLEVGPGSPSRGRWGKPSVGRPGGSAVTLPIVVGEILSA